MEIYTPNKNQLDSALIVFNKALRNNPKDTSLLSSRGSVYSSQKKYNEAINDFDEALKINPKFSDALNNRGLVFYQQNKYDLAISDFKKALEIKPDNALIMLNLILVYLSHDDFNEAARLYNQYRQKKLSSYMEVIKWYSFLKTYVVACCDYLVNKNYEKALPLLEASLQEYKEVNQDRTDIPVSWEYSNVLVKTGFVNEKLGQTEKALEFYRKAVVINPQLTNINSKIQILSGKVKNDVAANNIPPQIQLLTPVVLRGTTVENENNSNELFVSGTVKDNAGINWVKVNGKDIAIQSGGYFSTGIQSNTTSFTIQSANKNGLISSETFQLETQQNVKNNEENIPAIPPTAKPKFHAILIACSNYSGSKWKKLPTTKDEAMAYKTILTDHYGFKNENVLEIIDKERRDILSVLSSTMQSLDSSDNLVILFAGHGTYIKGENGSEPIGYWVPLNAESPIDYISNGNLSEIIYACKAKHILMISDACYSAAMRGSDEAEFDRLTERKEWQFKSRQMLTSGGFEKVPGESVFINMVIKALELNENKVLSAKALYNLIFTGVKNQTDREPELNIFGKDGNEGGQFYFIKQK